MRKWHTVTAASAAVAIGLALACCGKSDVVPAGDAGTDGGAEPTGACDHFFASVIERCSLGPAEPASEVARVRARWDAKCAAFLALPGLSPDASYFAACASAVEAGGCVTYHFPGCAQGACGSVFGYGDPGSGTLQAGSTCSMSAQCEEGVCSAGYELPDGGIPSCGACVSWIPIGQSWVDAGLACVPGAISIDGDGGVCVAQAQVGDGGSCPWPQTACSPGLCCTNGVCGLLAGLGAPCEGDLECEPPLICPGTNGNPAGTCANPGPAGAPCWNDLHCISGLGCDVATSTCEVPTYAAAGQACSASVRCLVGSCPVVNGIVGGVCPVVLADGQPCDPNDTTTTCDAFAVCDCDDNFEVCESGTCVLGPPPTCP